LLTNCFVDEVKNFCLALIASRTLPIIDKKKIEPGGWENLIVGYLLTKRINKLLS
jgi:hypothetical protein